MRLMFKSSLIKESVSKALFLCSAILSIIIVLIICVFLIINGLPAISKIGLSEFLSGAKWKPSIDLYGIFPMIIASIYVTAGAIIIGVPIGILTAIYLAEFCPRFFYSFFKSAINLLSGIPSVVFGLFGLTVIVPIIRDWFGVSGTSLLAASIVLSIMILPTIISVSQTAIESVPRSYYEGSLALGATHERSVIKAVLPAAKSGIVAGIILSIGRCVGETMAVVMVAGNQAVIPNSLLKGVRTLTANIVLEMGYASGLHRDALIATAVVLFVFILIINISFSLLRQSK